MHNPPVQIALGMTPDRSSEMNKAFQSLSIVEIGYLDQERHAPSQGNTLHHIAKYVLLNFNLLGIHG